MPGRTGTAVWSRSCSAGPYGDGGVERELVDAVPGGDNKPEDEERSIYGWMSET